MKTKPTQEACDAIEKRWKSLLDSLIGDVADDHRATDGPDDGTPGMCVTFGLSCDDGGGLSWNYQTGDNSFTGGAYGHRHWGVVHLYRDSDTAELAKDAMGEASESLHYELEN